MKTNANARPPGCAPAAVCKEAYGQLVVNMLDKQTGNEWRSNLWGIFSRYIECNSTNGMSVDLLNEYWTFRDLMGLFEDIEALQAGKEVKGL